MLSKILFGSLAIAANAQDQTIDAEKVEHMLEEVHNIEHELEELLGHGDAAPPAPAPEPAPAPPPPAPVEQPPPPAPVVKAETPPPPAPAPAKKQRRLTESEQTRIAWMKEATDVFHSFRGSKSGKDANPDTCNADGEIGPRMQETIAAVVASYNAMDAGDQADCAKQIGITAGELWWWYDNVQKCFIDYLHNFEGATDECPFCQRTSHEKEHRRRLAARSAGVDSDL